MKPAGKKNYYVFATVMFFTIIGLIYWIRDDSRQSIRSSTVSPAPAAQLFPADHPDLMFELISPYQHDTEIDGRLREDVKGNLIVDTSFKDLFDYFFSALGEKTQEQIAANMERYIDSVLSAVAAKQARAMLRSFMAYNQGLAEYAAAEDMDMSEFHGLALIDHLKSYHAYLKDARKRHFGEEYSEVFFGSEEKYQEYNIARLELSLSDFPEKEKKRRIEDLRSQLPEMQREIIREHEQVGEFMKQEHAWQTENVTDEELYNRRLASYGYDAAERMTALDRRNRQWQDRLEKFLAKINQINATDWSEKEKKYLIEEIKNSDFSETERLRVDVIARYRQQKTTARNKGE